MGVPLNQGPYLASLPCLGVFLGGQACSSGTGASYREAVQHAGNTVTKKDCGRSKLFLRSRVTAAFAAPPVDRGTGMQGRFRTFIKSLLCAKY